ncbi:34750_t:CDS:2, partial [Gigaspora margarita]
GIVPFETMRMLLGEALSNNLKLLPDSPNLIPEHITEFLPFALPITNRKQTRAVVAALRKIFSFIQLPSSYYYDNKELLPLDPGDLIDTLRNHFLITDYDSLSHLSEFRTRTKGPTSPYPARTATEPILALPTGPDALPPGLLRH